MPILRGSAMENSEHIVKILTILNKLPAKTMLGDMSSKYTAFQMLISTILSARTRDETTYPICEKLFRKYPTPEKLSRGNPSEIREMIRKIGFYENKTKFIIETSRIILEKYKGTVPDTMDELMTLPGVGRKVAGCVLVYAFHKNAIPVDTHVHRVSNRTKLVNTKLPEKTEEELMKITPKKYWQLVNDLFVWHGKNTCKPIVPECYHCPVVGLCYYENKNFNERLSKKVEMKRHKVEKKYKGLLFKESRCLLCTYFFFNLLFYLVQ
jgi:endonuclease-3